MRLDRKAAALFLTAILLIGCGREGFKASLDRDGSSQAGNAAGDTSDGLPADALVFDMDVGEMREDGVYLNYALPRATDPAGQEPAEHISEKIHTALFALPDEIADGKPVDSLTVFDALTRNDGVFYSVWYNIQYKQTKDDQKALHGFGLTFNAATGELVELDSVMETGALVALLLDAQSSKMLEKDEALAQKQRDYLNEQGVEALKNRLSYPNGVVSLERLLDASFYLDGDKLVAVFAAPQEIGGVIRASITL